MEDEILSYREMCDHEEIQTLQRGMNFRFSEYYSIILMSQRTNAPYKDRILEDGITIEYEGHDAPKRDGVVTKEFDQPYKTISGKLTQNGLFSEAVAKYRNGAPPELVKVYEKIFPGVWSNKGFFYLIDCNYIHDGKRKVFKFYLQAVLSPSLKNKNKTLKLRTRLIPSEIKKYVWIRDGGKCVICGATDELHFDHDIPYSKGGTSITSENVRILCARHNLYKSDSIM